ncbi:MAG: dATP/dGTP diphosphohydrolase domain-containing protein [Dehalococcoidales bacterium]
MAASSYIDKTGTDDKPNALVDVYQEFPLAMEEIARITKWGTGKHAVRGWQTFEHKYAIRYHTGKMGRHLLAEETEGCVNETDGGLLHSGQVAWNALARLEHILLQRKEVGDGTPSRALTPEIVAKLIDGPE